MDARDGRRDRRATTASTSSPTATGRSSTSCATPTSRPASAPTIRTLGKASGVPDQGALPALPQGPGEARREDRRHPQAARLHLGGDDHDRDPRPAARRGRRAAQDDREGRDRHLQGLARGHLPRPDHGQRRPHGGHRGERLLHVLRPRRDPQGPPGAHQGRDGRQPRHAHPDAARRAARHVRARHPDDAAPDGEARHPADPASSSS